MRAETPGITGIFQHSTKLEIPFFQRQYVWGEENWQRFDEDMMSLVGSRNKYFLGSLIFKEVDPEPEDAMNGVNIKYVVIDGQQRLTTLSIYLKVLQSLIPEDNIHNNFKSNFFSQDSTMNPVLCHSFNDRDAYQKVMWLDTPGGDLSSVSDKQVTKAYFYFYKALKNRQDLKKLLMAVYANIRFVTIVLDEHDDEQQIFDTINSLGVDLTIDELMKNYLYDAKHQTEYTKNWRPAFDQDSVRKFWGTDDAARRQTATDETKTIVSFFYNYVRIKMWDFKQQFVDNDRKAFVQKKNVFATCKAFHERFGMDKQELAEDIIEYSKLYRKYFDKNNLKTRVPSYPCIERLACIAMAKESTIIPYLLYILKNVQDVNERNKIFGFLEVYLMRRAMSLSSSMSKNYSEFFSETLIGNRLLSYDMLRNYFNKIDATQNMHMPSDLEMQINVELKALDEPTARLVYYLVETKTQNPSEIRGYDYYQAEMIMPTPSKANESTWPAPTDPTELKIRKEKSKSIGNFVQLVLPTDSTPATEKELIDKAQKEIKKCANQAFADKKTPLLKYAGQVRSSNWFSNVSTWDESAIDKRCESLVSHILKNIWTL